MIQLPTAFSQRWIQSLGQKDFDIFSGALGHESATSIRLNPLKKQANLDLKLAQSLPWHSAGHLLKERPIFTLDPAFHAGAYYVQEAASMFVAEAFKQIKNDKGGLKVLDLCAAPGGKSTLLADLLGPEDLLVVNEPIKNRVQILKENMNKWAYPHVIVAQHDPETFADLEGFFDVVLVDAPCSGEGLFRKDHEAVNEWSEDNAKLCSLRQQRILSAAAMLVKKNGYLIYSTCTYNPAENDHNVAWLKRTFDFSVVKLNHEASWGITETDHGLQFYPHKTMGEGFYIAVLQQNAAEFNRLKGKIDLARLNRRLVDYVNTWIQEEKNESLLYFQKKDGVICAIPEALVDDYAVVMRALFKRSSGIEIGILKGTDLVPSHGLALSSLVSYEINSIELSREQALKFLKKELIEEVNTIKGWCLVKYQGLGLGWIKNMENRQNNYLPTELRIRMDIQENKL
jgi:16S rRNA C967 or C1407 C5-methylase (RsmB/RsmF family)/NOL1/NOP2/fmu family ribosome biogenesis protein